MTQRLPILLAGCAWMGAMFFILNPTVAQPGFFTGLAIAGIFITVLVLIAVSRTKVPKWFWNTLAVLVILSASIAATSVAVMAGQPSRLLAQQIPLGAVTATATVSSLTSLGVDGRIWFDARDAEVAADGTEDAEATVPIRVGVPPDAIPVNPDPGMRIRVSGSAMAAQDGEPAALIIFGEKAEVLTAPRGVFAVASTVRNAFASRSASLPPPGAALLPGLAVGDTRAVGPELTTAMQTSGLSHLTAVSGSNCALIVSAAYFIVAVFGGRRWLRIVVAMAALAAFVVLVTPEPSVLRAAFMSGVGMITLLLGRPETGVGLLGLTVVVLLIADPWMALTPGFALSVVATAALLLLAPHLAHGLERWISTPLALLIAVPLAAQLACGPVLALFSPTYSLGGVVANLLAAPVAPLATVLGLVAALCMPIPALAQLFAASAWLPASWVATTARVISALPGTQISLIPGIPAMILVTLVSAAVTVVFLPPLGRTFMRRWIRNISKLFLVLSVALVGTVWVGSEIFRVGKPPSNWNIAVCDIGQGDAILLRSESATALIDTGPSAPELNQCLRLLGVDRIDLAVFTHFDLDHTGGAEAIIGRVELLLYGPSSNPADQTLIDRFQRSGAKTQAANAGSGGILGNSRWQVLWPAAVDRGFLPGNDTSVVMTFSGGSIPSVVLLGDLSAASQEALLHRGIGFTASSLVKVAHHGSADQYAKLYEKIQADVALISAGIENRYGHPRLETIELLENLGAEILRTDLMGTFTLTTTESGVRVWSAR